MKNLFVCIPIPEDAVPVQLAGPCPCGEGHVELIDYNRWVCRHTGSAPAEARTHRLPAVVADVYVEPRLRRRP
jgi:hypothetical protein